MRAAGRTLVDPEDVSKGVVQLRIGINSGPCMASVIGKKNPKYGCIPCMRLSWVPRWWNQRWSTSDDPYPQMISI